MTGNFWTRPRGCADLLIFGPLIFFVLILLGGSCAGESIFDNARAIALLTRAHTTNYGCVLPPMPSRGISAHAGNSLDYPGNTLPALQSAVDLGAHQIEFDVRRALDGLVVFHDWRLEDLTSGNGLVRDHTVAELQNLDVDFHFSGQIGQIPTLQEVLDIMPDNIWLNVNAKPHSGDHYALTRDIALVIEDAGRMHQSFVTTYNQDGVRGATSVSPYIQTVNLEGQRLGPEYTQETIDGRHDWIQLMSTAGELPEVRDMADLDIAGIRSNFYMGTTWGLEPDEEDYIVDLWDRGVDFVLVEDVAMSGLCWARRSALAKRRKLGCR